jgi:hypothetical protein
MYSGSVVEEANYVFVLPIVVTQEERIIAGSGCRKSNNRTKIPVAELESPCATKHVHQSRPSHAAGSVKMVWLEGHGVASCGQ